MADQLLVLGEPAVEGAEVEHHQPREVTIVRPKPSPRYPSRVRDQVDGRARCGVRLEGVRTENLWQLLEVWRLGRGIGGLDPHEQVGLRHGVHRDDSPWLPHQCAVLGVQGQFAVQEGAQPHRDPLVAELRDRLADVPSHPQGHARLNTRRTPVRDLRRRTSARLSGVAARWGHEQRARSTCDREHADAPAPGGSETRLRRDGGSIARHHADDEHDPGKPSCGKSAGLEVLSIKSQRHLGTSTLRINRAGRGHLRQGSASRGQLRLVAGPAAGSRSLCRFRPDRLG